MLNDTGSDALTVFDTDLIAHRSNVPGFWASNSSLTANGIVLRQVIYVEIQLLDSQRNPISDWILEESVVVPSAEGNTRLSGRGMRDCLYFATAPGNQQLYVAEKKNGIVQQLPVV
ncbi:LOW QUALITY PROTEIN: hypothetical protein H112_05666 [Trichophyton rubrum D6]|uniref:Uncharacterized protein n=3 Tax=Trichophyton TaxID=5550 RepID=A0A080WFT5_TRIRC|nr:LOW QUALITY PROTEIN: uncharacterized protein TERG_11994 [Trichophyton rubrum CBS 118892]EZF16671.1 LOW QUALITY PROTEIN: hypothetical protein H100_05683 [Trichophyton rubrum MR850]EZF40352.1 LOW QUALITY PROTEIN: hypothetical protein H102_05652 [Trichophyton rubrum CBS 100081]EZF50857.1 LOW QUALITY PROTEIN: hypothetical protein H103_05679 [Trichophyton rubrum CBS 288.86]EZF61575.1 LOW QUALITY PROTEIN: hypothetical protein H104_05664 [Trichophyton rubrum CBS 289.86]EZF72338.1 LOW QUALITY PROTE